LPAPRAAPSLREGVAHYSAQRTRLRPGGLGLGDDHAVAAFREQVAVSRIQSPQPPLEAVSANRPAYSLPHGNAQPTMGRPSAGDDNRHEPMSEKRSCPNGNIKIARPFQPF